MTLFGALRLPAEILFGAGQRHALGRVAQRLGQRALVVTDARFAATPAFAGMVADLEQAGLVVQVHDAVLPDVPVASVAEGVAAVRGREPDLVVGIGGGSCLDFAKCAALLLSHGGALQDYYGEFKVPGPVLPLIAVPTTAGTGSEVTPVAVISDAERTLKVGISSPYLISRVAICDPELTLSCPPMLSAIAGADALTHAIEAFTALKRTPDAALTQEHVFIGKNALTDQQALHAIGLLGHNLERAVSVGEDLEARSAVMMAAMAAGAAFGTAGTAAAHAIQSPVGALTHTPHGLGVAALLPYVMAYNRPACETELAQVAVALGAAEAADDRGHAAQAAIDAVVRLFAAIGIPRSLGELGLPTDQLDWTAEQALGIGRLIKNNPRPLDLATMRRLVRAAHAGDLAAAAEA
jgi:alcohol dehydrogenase